MHATDKVMLIFADPLLPRIVELATTSSDRQTKVSDVYVARYILYKITASGFLLALFEKEKRFSVSIFFNFIIE